MLRRIILAAIYAAFAWLVCVFVGGLFAMSGVPLAAYVGQFLVQWAVLVSILVFLWYFVSGGDIAWPALRR